MKYKLTENEGSTALQLGSQGQWLPETMTKIFGEGNFPAMDPKSGYDAAEWILEGPEGVAINVYKRWGSWSIGAKTKKDADDFNEWLVQESS